MLVFCARAFQKEKKMVHVSRPFRNKGDYAAAESLYRRSLAIKEKALGPDHPKVARSRRNLARLLEAKAQAG